MTDRRSVRIAALQTTVWCMDGQCITRRILAAFALCVVTVSTWVVVAEGNQRLHKLACYTRCFPQLREDPYATAHRVSWLAMDMLTMACTGALVLAWYRYAPRGHWAARFTLSLLILMCWAGSLPALT